MTNANNYGIKTRKPKSALNIARNKNTEMMEALKLCFILFASIYCAACGVDRTIDRGANGADVVHATIAKIESSGIFQSDRRLLRRIAYAETRDGADSPLERNFGGLWKVSADKFASTKNDDTLVSRINTTFCSELASSGINSWEELQWEALNVPLWSGIAARLSLPSTVRIPTSSDINGQARFWANYYHKNGNKSKFSKDIEQLQEDEGCNIKSDIIFVLDSSGSIGSYNYDEVIHFTRQFVEQLNVSLTANRVGVITYGSAAETVFNLNTFCDKKQVLWAIDRIIYASSGSNTADGLCLMLEGFSEENGARLSESNVFRLAIVMTDGHSGGRSFRCDSASTLEMAEMVHNFSHPIISFAIGVTTNVNEEELEAIASKPEYVTYLSSFDDLLFTETSDEHTYELCEKITIPVELGVQKGTIEMGGKVRYELQLPEEGVTVRLCVNGSVSFYASATIPNPNEALHDYRQTVTSGRDTACNAAFIPQIQEPTCQKNTEEKENKSPHNNVTIFMALKGMKERNEFSMEILKGDHTPNIADQASVAVISSVVTIVVVLFVVTGVGILTVFVYLWKKKQKDAE